jgi:hypothetical protein
VLRLICIKVYSGLPLLPIKSIDALKFKELYKYK